jgi:hypothetical protein
MTEQLPPLKDFEAIRYPPEAPVPRWRCYVCHVFICFFTTVAGAAYEALDAYDLIRPHSRNRFWTRGMSHDEFTQWIVKWVILVAVVGFCAGVLISIAQETHERNKRARLPRHNLADD